MCCYPDFCEECDGHSKVLMVLRGAWDQIPAADCLADSPLYPMHSWISP